MAPVNDAWSIAPNLVCALLLGVIIGLERQWRQRHTGLTTHALVALGAAAFTSLALLMEGSADIRMGGQVVTGIGFLGAGLIMRDGLSVRGLSGAATVWATGAVGTLAGYGHLLAAAETALFVLLINLVMPRLGSLMERHLSSQDEIERYYVVELKCTTHDEAAVRAMLLEAMNVHKLRLRGLESKAIKDSTNVDVEAIVYSAKEQDQLVEQLVGDLSRSPLVFATKWTSTNPHE